jgi:hypothetical protein
MAETQNTPACASQFRIPAEQDGPIDEVRVFLDLGSGVGGHPHICHGGFVAVGLDEVMGLLPVANEERDRELNAKFSWEGRV